MRNNEVEAMTWKEMKKILKRLERFMPELNNLPVKVDGLDSKQILIGCKAETAFINIVSKIAE